MLTVSTTAIDPTWGAIITVLITTIGGIIVALLQQMRLTQRKVANAATAAADSIGEANGHGSVHQTLDTVLARQDHILTRLQAQDAAAEAEWERRDVGQRRSLQMQEALHTLQAMVVEIKIVLTEQGTWQVSHAEGDTQAVEELTKSLEELRYLLGDPVEGMDQIIPWVQGVTTAHGRLVQEAVDTLTEARILLAEIRDHKETP